MYIYNGTYGHNDVHQSLTCLQLSPDNTFASLFVVFLQTPKFCHYLLKLIRQGIELFTEREKESGKGRERERERMHGVKKEMWERESKKQRECEKQGGRGRGRERDGVKRKKK